MPIEPDQRARPGRDDLRSTLEGSGHWAEVRGRRVFARRWTDQAPAGREPLLLVHGLGVSSRYMIPTGRALAPTVPVWAPDLPGFGRSEKPDRVLDLDALTEALVGWMDAVGIGRAAMLGNSLGCQLIVRVALRYPDRISRAVLTGPTADPHASSVLHYAVRAVRDLVHESPALYPILLYDYLVGGVWRFWRTFLYLVADSIEEMLPRVEIPTLVVRGSNDTIVPHRWAAEAAALLPHGALATIEGAPHAVNFSAPDRLAALVTEFLERTS